MCMVVSLMCNLIARIVSTGSQSVNIPHLIMISPTFSVTQVQVCNKTSCVKTNTLT